MKLALKWRKAAQTQRKSIFAYYNKRNGNDEYSFRLNQRINAVLEKICRSPEYRPANEQTSYQAVWIEERFALFYRITDDSIEVTAIVDARQDKKLD